jgi:hypothetical protein
MREPIETRPYGTPPEWVGPASLTRPVAATGVTEVRPVTLIDSSSYKAPVPPDRTHNCIGNDGTCGAFKAKGTDYCAGHLRSQGVIE